MNRIYLFLSFMFFLSPLAGQNNVGIGTTEPEAKLHVRGDETSTLTPLFSEVTYSEFSDVPGIWTKSIVADGWGIGGTFDGGYIGVTANAYAGSYAGIAYGLYGDALGTQGTRIGVYGRASGGDVNWAGFFEGQGKFTGPLSLDQSLSAIGSIETDHNLFVADTTFASVIHTCFNKPVLNIRADKDLSITIDQLDNPDHTAVFRLYNGAGEDVFGADENGNARTYGTHYIDGRVIAGVMLPTVPLNIGDGNLVVLGTNSFQSNGDRGIVYLGGVHHYIAGEYGYGVRIGTYAVGDALGIHELTGDVFIGRPANADHAAGYKLTVDGRIIGEELKIQDSDDWPDYVFEEGHQLLPLDQLEKKIRAEGHLPGIPSAGEIEAEGILVGDMQKRMMAKIEELTLYILELDKEVRQLKERNRELEEKLDISSFEGKRNKS